MTIFDMVFGRETCFKLNVEDDAFAGAGKKSSVFAGAPVLQDLQRLMESKGTGQVLEELFKAFEEAEVPVMENFVSWLYHILCADRLIQQEQPDADAQLRHQVAVTSPPSISLVQCQAYLKEISENSTQRVCSVAFRPGDIVWNCKQCQKDSTCVLCQSCYQDSDHRGHDVFFYHVVNEGGGCCDCGDAGAWDPKGFCSRHSHEQRADQDPSLSLPDKLKFRAQFVMAKCVDFITKTALMEPCKLVLRRTQANISPTDRQLVIDAIRDYQTKDQQRHSSRYASTAQWEAISKWLENGPPLPSPTLASANVRADGATDGLVSSFASALVTPPHEPPPVASHTVKELPLLFVSGSKATHFRKLYSSLANIGGIECVVVGADSKAGIALCIQVVKWMLGVCQQSDGLTRVLCNELVKKDGRVNVSFLETLILRDVLLPSCLTSQLHDLYIRLLVDSEFKRHYAIAYAKTYVGVYGAYLEDSPKLNLDALETSTIFGLSVQFLNRALFVEMLVKEHSLLESMFTSFLQLIGLSSLNRPNVDIHNSIVLERKYLNLTTDLRYILQVKGIAKHLCKEHPTLMKKWHDILARTQLIDAQVRHTVFTEQNEWVSAFHLYLHIANLFSHVTLWLREYPPPQDHGEDCVVMIRDTTRALQQWIEDLFRSNPSLTAIKRVNSRLGEFDYFPWDLSEQAMSFHIPLHRYCSFLMRTCIQSTSMENDLRRFVGCGTQHFWLAFARFPLNALVMSAQIDAGMWRLNGEMMEQQNNNYKLIPLCYHKRDLDITALQLTAAHLKPSLFLLNLSRAFGFTDFLQDTAIHLKLEHRQPMLKALLHLLGTLTTELPVPTRFLNPQDSTHWRSDRYEFRRDIIHRLAAGAATFSQLTECSTPTCIGVAADSAETELEKLLAVVGRQVGSASNRLKPITYELAQDMWNEFNPFYHHLAPADREEARERWIRNRPAAPTAAQPCFPGDAKLPSDAKVCAPTSAIRQLPIGHPVFEGMRDALVRSKPFGLLVQAVLNGCVYHMLTYSEGTKVHKYFVELYAGSLDRFRQSWNSDVAVGCQDKPGGSDELLSLALFLLTVQLHVLSHDKRHKPYYVQDTREAYEWTARDKETMCVGDTVWREKEDVLAALLEEADGRKAAHEEKSDAVLRSTSTLSCLLILWHGGRSVLERSNLESIRWILAQLHQRSDACSSFMTLVQQCHISQVPKTKSKQKRSSRKRKAQKHMMEKMKQHQLQWMKLFPDELSDSKSVSSASGSPQSSSKEEVLECIVCREVATLKEADFVMLGIMQHSQVLRRSAPGKCVRWCTENTGMIQLCGHAMHPTCLATYVSSLTPFNSRNNVETMRSDFLCPLCKSLSNVSVPAVPHFRPPSALELSKCCSDAVSMEAAFQAIAEMDVTALPESSGATIPAGYTKLLRNFMLSAAKLSSADPEDLRQLIRNHFDLHRLQENKPPLDHGVGAAISSTAYTMVVNNTFAIKYADSMLQASDINGMRRVLRAVKRFLDSEGSEVMKKLMIRVKRMVACGNATEQSVLLLEEVSIMQYSTEMLLMLLLLNGANPSVLDVLALLRLCQALYDYTPVKPAETNAKPGVLGTLRKKLIISSSGPLPTCVSQEEVSEDDLREFVSADMKRFFQAAKAMADCCQPGERDSPLSLTLEEEFPDGVLSVVLRAAQHVLESGALMGKLEEWMVRYKFSIENTADVIRDQARALDVSPLVRLGHSYTELYSRVHAGTCADCKGPTHDRAVCLLCGESLLAGSHEPREFLYTHVHELSESQYGECTKHILDHHAGVGVLFLFSKPCLLLIHGTKAAYWPSIYTDQYGEDQRAAPRSLPMFFDEQRFRQVERMWLEHKLAYEVTSRRNKATFTITQGYY